MARTIRDPRGHDIVRGVLRQVYFCIGAAKTGTTILSRLLDQQPTVACMWEGFLLRPDHSSSVLNPDAKAWRRHGLPAERVKEWHERALERVDYRGRDVMAMRHPLHVRSIVGEVLETFGALTSATTVGDKWPDYHRNLNLMLRAFPDAKMIYNVRDPRGVWNSGQTFRDRQAGDKVLANMLSVDEAVSPHLGDERFFTLRYEDLIADPASRMSEVAAFLGFAFDPESIVYDASADPLPNRWYWIPSATDAPDVRLAEKWRIEMPLDKQAEITRTCGEFITRYGYE